MSDLDKLFCKVGCNYIEGYLDDENHDPELLFVLKEPDASAKNVTDFWFKRNVMPNPQGLGKTYFKVLGETARKLIGNQDDDYSTVLKRCAFINIYPFSGKASASNDFKTVVKMLGEAKAEYGSKITDQSCANEIACNRKAIIFGHKWKYVVSVNDVFEQLIPEGTVKFDGFKTKKITRPAFYYQGAIFLKIHHPNRASYKEFEEMEFKKDTDS